MCLSTIYKRFVTQYACSVGILFTPLLPVLSVEPPGSLTGHLRGNADLGELRDIRAEWKDGVLKLSAAKAEHHAWVAVPAPREGWKLGGREVVESDVINTGGNPVGVMMWVVGDHGWDAVLDMAVLAPGEARVFSCKLGASFPDGTPKLDPLDVKQVQFMLAEPAAGVSAAPDKGGVSPRLGARITRAVSLEVRSLAARGEAPAWKRPPGRLDVPALDNGQPAPGKRVRYRVSGDEGTGIYSVLNLPEDWQSGKSYPVVFEFPGNVFYSPACYSTGLPDQCVIGYGMTRGKGAICIGLPFVDRVRGRVVENGWGNPDETADYAVRIVDEVCGKFGGDRENMVLTGFSRGAIACGYIGLRSDSIAPLWKGFHACQHYDGDGWNGATLQGALERGARFRGEAVFQTDNPREKFQSVMEVMNTRVTWVNSGLGFHSTAMFLDDRPSTQMLRAWFWDLVQGTKK